MMGSPWRPVRTITLTASRATLRFYHADCLTLLPTLPAGSVSAIVTSPPYNLGIRYRTYADSLPGERYLKWTGEWVEAASRLLAPDGSLFLNVGARPTDPWTAIDIALAARPHLKLQNTLHWVKSVAIDRDAVGSAAGIDQFLLPGPGKDGTYVFPRLVRRSTGIFPFLRDGLFVDPVQELSDVLALQLLDRGARTQASHFRSVEWYSLRVPRERFLARR